MPDMVLKSNLFPVDNVNKLNKKRGCVVQEILYEG